MIFASLIGCQEKAGCLKYSREIYIEETIDNSLVEEALEYYDILLNKFGVATVKGLAYEAYHLQFYSSHGYGTSIKFENKFGGYKTSVKCVSKEGWFEECMEYQIRIEKEEWEALEKMIYEFDFWTTEDFRSNNALDGYAIFLEGNRPDAEECNKKVYKLVGRGSPRYDKMEALSYNIRDFESQLRSRYDREIR